MANVTYRNTTKSPRGFYRADGSVVTVQPGATVEVDAKIDPGPGFEKAKAAPESKE